jgi:hypothetical protein
MKKILLLFLLAISISFCYSQSQKTNRLSPEEFVILPWGWTAGDSTIFKDIYDCGFNLAGFVSSGDLEKVSKAGLKAILSETSTHVGDAESALSEGEIIKRVNELALKTSENSAVFGYYLRDEPGTSVFAGLKRWKDAWAKASPRALAYINLFPNYASNDKQLQAESYEDYLEKYVSAVKPSFISYDNYSLMADGSIRKGYFENLGAVRAIALKNNILFWNIVLSNSHFNYADPSYQGLCFQLYTTLAYGGRGISYFTYFAPKVGNYRYAPIDQFGNKTSTWFLLQNVNLQMHAIGKVYIKLKSINVFHYPEMEECKGGLESSRFLSSLKGENLLVGEFEDESRIPYIIVVNKSLVKSQSIDLSFKEKGTIFQINNYTGEAEQWSGENNWIAPGQGRIFFVRKLPF